ncbi:MAG TPA: HAD family phosphatase [Candidatus Acidoferrales bacterium]|nr:HAD family phosphatase [Candidatus Acidoferrales bacterium]
MNLRFQGAAFDLEGTLVDLESAHHLGHLDAAAEVGLDLSLEEAVRDIPAFVGGPDIEIAKAIQARVRQPVDLEHLLARMKFHYYFHRQRLDVRVRSGFDHVLSNVQRLGVLTCLGSATEKAEGLELLRQTRLMDHFPNERLVFAEDVISRKPAPDVYLETARRMKIKPSQQIVFEDSVPGILAAVAAGSTVVAIPVFKQEAFLKRLKSAGAIQICRNWDDVDARKLCII